MIPKRAIRRGFTDIVAGERVPPVMGQVAQIPGALVGDPVEARAAERRLLPGNLLLTVSPPRAAVPGPSCVCL